MHHCVGWKTPMVQLIVIIFCLGASRNHSKTAAKSVNSNLYFVAICGSAPLPSQPFLL